MVTQRILFVTSEIFPLIKTGGLADVSGSLPLALRTLDQDVRVFLPAYRDVVESLDGLNTCAGFRAGDDNITLLEGRLPGSDITIWLLHHPRFVDRHGNPYVDGEGVAWADTAERFTLFARAVVEVAMNRAGLDWQPTVVHCNDWQSGLVPALLALEHQRPATLFTIHNLAYQGIFPRATFEALRLPERLWALDAVEFHDQFSFIKGGLAFSDRINTVSPNYAEEIKSAEFGCGLDGLITQQQHRLSGILNGIDEQQWNPATDPHLTHHYSLTEPDNKALNKAELQRTFNLPEEADTPLFSLIGRLVPQKGIDLLLALFAEFVEMPVQLVMLGSGEHEYEQRLTHWANRFPDKIAVQIGYDESLSHRIEAGADIFLMPSRFEPCGLNQMYSQRYGTVPIVCGVGGLADTVVDVLPAALDDHSATGIVFKEPSSGALLEAIKRALLLYHQPALWQQIQQAGMTRDFSWQQSAEQYLTLYQSALDDRIAPLR